MSVAEFNSRICKALISNFLQCVNIRLQFVSSQCINRFSGSVLCTCRRNPRRDNHNGSEVSDPRAHLIPPGEYQPKIARPPLFTTRAEAYSAQVQLASSESLDACCCGSCPLERNKVTRKLANRTRGARFNLLAEWRRPAWMDMLGSSYPEA